MERPYKNFKIKIGGCIYKGFLFSLYDRYGRQMTASNNLEKLETIIKQFKNGD